MRSDARTYIGNFSNGPKYPMLPALILRLPALWRSC
jgi:hypothetical protein